LSTVARETVLLPIRAYRRFLSPVLGQRCRYYPSCSAYAEESVRELGAFRGMILAVWRVLRCNPFSRGGLDPVSERTLFRSPPASNAQARSAHSSDRENFN
jgi:putative membrane protein insertion efficiency factor